MQIPTLYRRPGAVSLDRPTRGRPGPARPRQARTDPAAPYRAVTPSTANEPLRKARDSGQLTVTASALGERLVRTQSGNDATGPAGPGEGDKCKRMPSDRRPGKKGRCVLCASHGATRLPRNRPN